LEERVVNNNIFASQSKSYRILLDAREFVHSRFTGIGRVLEGLTNALVASGIVEHIVLTAYDEGLLPSLLKETENIKVKEIPASFIKSEKCLSDLTGKDFSLFISPYPKLPLFGCHCPSVHIIHDILDLTHPAYRKMIKSIFDSFRLRRALRKADLSWYDSSWSLNETKKYTGLIGRNPRVRYPGIDEKFKFSIAKNQHEALAKYKLEPGYVLVIGNGLPHKNLGIILEIADLLNKTIAFVGVPEKNQSYWQSKYPDEKAAWIKHVTEEDLPAIIKGAFCLAQPSTAEGYGYPPLEAMACGIPTVVSDIPVLVETTGGNALAAHPHDSKIWLETFEKLENGSTYQELVEKGLKWVEPLRGRKAWQDYISDIEELLERG
jgi:glycosyltransferase involved in cell wall biosynthesis